MQLAASLPVHSLARRLAPGKQQTLLCVSLSSHVAAMCLAPWKQAARLRASLLARLSKGGAAR